MNFYPKKQNKMKPFKLVETDPVLCMMWLIVHYMQLI